MWEWQNNIQNTCSNLLLICTTTSNRLAARSENAKTKQILNIQYLNSHLGSVLLLQTVPFCTGERISGLGCAGFDELSRSWLSPTPFSTPAVVSFEAKNPATSPLQGLLHPGQPLKLQWSPPPLSPPLCQLVPPPVCHAYEPVSQKARQSSAKFKFNSLLLSWKKRVLHTCAAYGWRFLNCELMLARAARQLVCKYLQECM